MLTPGFAGLAFVASAVAAQGIYSCVDTRGRTITADRPIAECSDRMQRELSGSGLMKRQLGPSLTAHEQAEKDEKVSKIAEARAREAENRRRDKALLQRYPTLAGHNYERAAALLQVDELIKAATQKRSELASQRRIIDSEFELYARNPSKRPAFLKRRLEENESSAAAEKKFISDQELEKKRVNQRFDEELAKLRQLWALAAVSPASGAANPKAGQN